MKQTWLYSVFPIAALFSFRMLGLFMLIPVFTVYANELSGATPTLIGIALGSYGLSQGLLQMPFGLLSDRFGRKPMITLGLLLFALGSLLGATTSSIYGMIIARTLQGTGAIGSVLIALLADLTLDKDRIKAMAVIGMTIGLSFSLAMVISPAMTHYFGLAGIFYLTISLAFLGLLLLYFVIPTPITGPFQAKRETNLILFKRAFYNTHLQRLNISIFCQHFVLTATFFAIPLLLQHHIKRGHLSQSWHFYLPLMLLSFIFMIPFIFLAEKKRKIKSVFLGAVFASALCQFILAFTNQYWIAICSLMFVYFVAFNILEASLPSLVSRQASADNKGTAMGIYSSCQFLGIFAGGAIAGMIYQGAGAQGIFLVNGSMTFFWLLITFYIQPNAYEVTLTFSFNPTASNSNLANKLRELPGVLDVIIIEVGVIHLRVNKAYYQEGSAETVLKLYF